MLRGRNNPVTHVPVLIRCSKKEQQGRATFLGEGGAEPFAIRPLVASDLSGDSPNSPLRRMTKAELEQFSSLASLMDAFNSRDALQVKTARAKLIRALAFREKSTNEREVDFVRRIVAEIGLEPEQQWLAYELNAPIHSNERTLLSSVVTEALNSVRLVLWWSENDGVFVPALYCPELKSALYVYYLMKKTAQQGIRVCPHCGVFFIQARSDQDYCSVAHREAHRVARWRAKKNMKTKKGAKKNVSRKAR